MAKYVLAADYTLMTDYRNVPLATFFSCIPTDYWHSRLVFRILADPPKLDAEGRPIRVPYGLRKVEASLVRAYGRDDVVIADPRTVDRYIDDETEVVGLHSMDPLGLGPVSMSFTMGGVLTPYTKAMFLELVQRVQRPNRKYKVVLGGPGAWHFDYRQEMQESLGIDHIVHGEVDHLVPEIFDRIVNDHAPPVMRFTNATAPTVDQIPKILGPTMHAMNEVMRGCGRGCEFCEVTLRRPRYFPLDYIGDEIAVNTKVGQSSIQLHSDDIFLYNLENWKTMEPNEDAVKDLFRYVMAQPGVSHCYPTHGTLSAAVTNPGLIQDISEIVRAGPGKWVGIQSGIETGSPALSRAVLHRKAAPFTAEEWPDIVVQGTQILNRNYWYPAFTIILGLPGETPEDAWMTVDLIDRMEQIPDGHFITAPLTFVPIGVLRGEEFYNIDEMIDESRFNVAYRAWRHVLLEIDEDLWHLTRLPAPTRALVVATARIGGRYILGIMHRYARRMGFRIRAPAKTRRQAEGHTLSFPAG
ncbi:MAG: B12-binding domain-containing radical SAM protein [Methanobacteriota archaeon]|nr:MAG: B12-binding domain-containing radical SAM protein [Euryarchaeota archaeon]